MKDFDSEVNPDSINLRLLRQRNLARSAGLVGTFLTLGNGARVIRLLGGSATLDFPNTGAQNSADLTITVVGAVAGDPVMLGVPNGSVNANTCFTAWVSAADTVSVRFNNYSAGAVNPASGAFQVIVLGRA